MHHSARCFSLLSTRLGGLLLGFAALAGFGLHAKAAFSTAAFSALNTQLSDFAAEKTTPPAQPKTPTLLTAKADDLVYAIYQVTQQPQFASATAARDVVETALTAIAGKVRADKDKIAPRLVDAAVTGANLTTGADVAQVVLGVFNANAGINKQLTTNGKAATIGQALKNVNGLPEGEGAAIGNVATLVATNQASLQSFLISSIKPVGTAVGGVKSFFSAALQTTLVPPTSRDGFAVNVAKGVVASTVGGAGEVIGGRAADIVAENGLAGLPTAGTDTAVTNLTQLAIKNPALAKAIGFVVLGTADTLSPLTSPEQFTSDLIGANGLGTKATAVNRGLVASGVIGNLTAVQVAAGKVGQVITASLVGKTLSPADYATYTGAACGNTYLLAADVVAKVLTLAPLDLTVRKNIGIAAEKAVSSTLPDAALGIAQKLIDGPGNLYNSEGLKTQLAKDLAKGIPTSAPTAGFAVAGVATRLANQTSAAYADLAVAVIPTASKAALNIAQQLSALIGSGADYKGFATSVASRVSTSLAGSVAAGVAVTAIPGNAAPGGGQAPGDIAAAVANFNAALQPKAAVIAGAVAVAVDVERIADVGGKIAALYQPTGSTSKLPKLTSIGALATSLAKAVNTKPFVDTKNRVDELGELAAEMTRSAINTLTTANATEATYASALSTIGTSIMKGLSASLLIDGGAFPADLKDASGDIAGAIAQTISVMLGGSNTPALQAIGNDLIAAGSTLEKALAKAAKAFSSDVSGTNGAFAQVRNATGNSGRLVTGSDPLGVGEVPTGQTGKYEIGSFVDPETPVKNL